MLSRWPVISCLNYFEVDNETFAARISSRRNLVFLLREGHSNLPPQVVDALTHVLNAFLWRLGGAGARPFRKNWRRIGYPLLAAICAGLSGVIYYKVIAIAIACHLSTRPPLTLIGDDIHKHWLNWIWLWVLGYLLGLPAVILHGWHGFLFALIPAATLGISVSLSNLKLTASIFTHEFCEGVIGFSVFFAINPL